VDGLKEFDRQQPDHEDFNDWSRLEIEFAKRLPQKIAEVEERREELEALGLFSKAVKSESK
jgi:hypothetical protein